MKRYSTRQPQRRADDDCYEERHYHHIEVSGPREPYWTGLLDHRGDEVWACDHRPIGFCRDDD